MKMKINRKIKNPNREEDISDEDFVFADLGKQISPLIIIIFNNIFILHLLLEARETVSIMVNTT